MTKKHAERVRVRGKCAAGHVTETTSEKGRVTRTLECSTPGCELEVLCRRIPSTEAPREAGKPTKLPSGAQVRRIASYERNGSSDGAGAGVAPELDGAGAGPVSVEHAELRADGPPELGFEPGRRTQETAAPPELVPGVI